MSNVYVYDWETIINCATITFEAVDDDIPIQFVFSQYRNDIEAFLTFLDNRKLKLVGYNNLGFDYPILHLFLIKPKNFWLRLSGKEIAEIVYAKSQEIIANNNNPFKPRKFIKPLIPQRDVFLIWHFNNTAKSTSLKWVQCSIRWLSIEEMPYSHSRKLKENEIEDVLRYNLNDVRSTKAFYLMSAAKIEMRYALSNKFGINFQNDNDTKIGEKILLNKIAEVKGILPSELNLLRTKRDSIKIADCLLPCIKFTTNTFNDLLTRYKHLEITKTKGEVDFNVYYDKMEYAFATGGLHAARKNTLYKDEEIDYADVSSYYPNLGIRNGFHPEHLGLDFCNVYLEIYNERKKYAKKTPENEGLKLALNGSYGKSNNEYSFLYDPKYTMQITLNGQLLLAMLCEWITERKAGKIIMVNTDGIEVQVYNRRLYKEICQEWQEMTNLELEFTKYKLLAIRDVNNYFGILENGKTKEKGAYEIDKEIHKDLSMRIVSLAVREAFLKNVPAKDFIHEHQDMWDFFMYNRAKTGKMMMGMIDESDYFERPLPKTIRYYISNSGGIVILLTDKKRSKLHSRYYQTVMNDATEFNFDLMKCNLNRQFYISEANKLLINTHDLQTKKNESLMLF